MAQTVTKAKIIETNREMAQTYLNRVIVHNMKFEKVKNVILFREKLFN